MDEKDLIEKMAYSSDKIELGKIISAKNRKLITTGKQIIEVVIHYHRFLRRESFITLDISTIKGKTDEGILLDISYDQFKLKVIDYHHQKKTYKKKKEREYQKLVTKGLDRGYYHKKRKNEW